jgi:hypothetical protein
MKTAILGVAITMMFVSGAFAQLKPPVTVKTTYAIFNLGSVYKVQKTLKTTTTLGSEDGQSLSQSINLIKIAAAGEDCIINFGTETGKLKFPLNIGSAGIIFDGGESGKEWGTISLTGAVTSKSGADEIPTITMVNGVSVNSSANVTNTGLEVGGAFTNAGSGTLTITGGTVSMDANYYGVAVLNATTGKVNVSGGTIKNTVAHTNGRNAYGIYNTASGEINVSGGTISVTNNAVAIHNNGTGAVNISGGTVKAVGKDGLAVHNKSTGKVTVSGTATKVASENTAAGEGEGTIYLDGSGSAVTTARLEVKGGIVENTAASADGNAVYNNTKGAINVSGGTVYAEKGVAINNKQNGAVNLSGGIVQGTSGYAVSSNEGKVTVSDSAMVTSAHLLGTIHFGGKSQLDAFNMTGGTVKNTIAQEILGGCAVYSTNENAKMSISGGTLHGRALTISALGEITLSGNPTIISPIGYHLGKLKVVTDGATPFAPDAGKVYGLSFDSSPNLAAGLVAVTGGAAFINNFQSFNDKWGLTATGSNLVLKEQLVFYITAPGVLRQGSAAATPIDLNGRTTPVAIGDSAKGQPCTIYFGGTFSTLEVSGMFNFPENVQFGLITLKGKLKNTSATNPAIAIYGNTSMIISADIESEHQVISHHSSGTLNIIGGTLKSNTTNDVVYSRGTGKITVSGTAALTSAATGNNAVINLGAPTAGDNTDVRLEIADGTVVNTSSVGKAILNNSKATVIISSGEISARGSVVTNNAGGTLLINGGTVSTPAGTAVYNGPAGGTINIGGEAKIKATKHETDDEFGIAIANFSTATVWVGGGAVVSATNAPAIFNDQEGRIIIEGNAVVTSDNEDNYNGTIFLEGNKTSKNNRLEIRGGHIINTVDAGNGVFNTSTGSVIISGGTVENTMDGVAVHNIDEGEVIISGGTLKSADGTAIQNGNKGKITISGGDISGGGGALYNGYGTVTVEGSAHLWITGSDGDAIFNANGLIRIVGGTVESPQYAVGGSATSSTAEIVLGGDPLIIGDLRYQKGRLSIINDDRDDDFAPSGDKRYSLALQGTPAAGDVAVTGGAEFINNFTFSDPTLGLTVSGDNIVLAQAYAITVQNTGNGTASASMTSAVEGREILLTAIPDPGYRFYQWFGADGLTVTDNKFTMPEKAVTVTAAFEVATTYAVTVTSGAADRDEYEEGELVTITAAAPAAGKAFDKWTSADGVTFASATSASTTFEMLAKAVTVTATYKTAYAVTVVNGATDKAEAGEGATVKITADAPEEGYVFDKWTSADVIIDDSTSAVTTFVMPAKAVTVTAVYKAATLTPIIYGDEKKSDKRGELKLLPGNIVSKSATIAVEGGAQLKVVIYDNTGNVVFERTERGSKVEWDLTNSAGRNVANGSYLLVVEAKNAKGQTSMHKAKLGVKR